MLILVGIVAGVLIAVLIVLAILFEPLEMLVDLIRWLDKITRRKGK